MTQAMETEHTLNTSALRERFEILCKRWKEECVHVSSSSDLVANSYYQQIIGMGSAVIPFILEENCREPNHWSYALRQITGEDPVPAEHKGNILRMADDWMQWGIRHGHLR